jgi:2-isopropylmalate synthase
MLKDARTFEIMRPEDVGLQATSIVLGKHSGRAALRSKLQALGFDIGDNQLRDVFVRFKALADRKKEVFEDDLVALMQDQSEGEQRLRVERLRVVCGTDGPQTAELTLVVDGEARAVEATGDGPIDATFNAVRRACPHGATLELYQVHAVTGGTDAQGTVTVRLEEAGRIASAQASDTDTVVASAKAYVAALARLLHRRAAPEGADRKTVTMRSA